MSDFIFKIDHFVGKLFHNFYLWGGEFSTFIMKGISLIAEAGILFLLIGFGLALFKRTRKTGATILIAVAIGFILTNVILKNLIERARPFANISGDFYKWWLDAGASYESGYSFPSGHTTATTAFSVAIFLTTNKKHSWYILLLPLLMASSRIYLMVHFFSDCLGAFVVGTLASVIAYLIIKLIYTKNVKLFIWLREFDTFKPKQKIEISTSKTQNPTNEFVYQTQQDETQNKQIEDTANEDLTSNTQKDD